MLSTHQQTLFCGHLVLFLSGFVQKISRGDRNQEVAHLYSIALLVRFFELAFAKVLQQSVF